VLLQLLALVLAVTACVIPAALEPEPLRFLAWGVLVAALARAAACLARVLARDGDGAPRWSAGILLFEVLAGAISTWTEILGRTSLATLALGVLLVLAVSERLLRSRSRALPAAGIASGASGAASERALVAGALVLAASAWGIVSLNAVRNLVQNSDAMWYHLPMVAEWLQGRGLAPTETIPALARAYPALRAGALAFLSFPLGNEHLALLGPVELVALGLAAAALAREWGLDRAVAVGCGALALALPIARTTALAEGTDLFLALSVVIAVLFARRFALHARGEDAILTGLGLGALAAAKYSGLIFAPALAVLFILEARALGPRTGAGSRRFPWKNLGLAVGVALAIAMPYYVRNLFLYGNPLWPARIAPLGIALFEGPYDRAYFASQTLGFDLAPLVQHAEHFRQAFGWTVLLQLTAPLLVLAASASGRRSWSASIVPLLAPPLLLFLFLRQPFNRPGATYAYNTRYLLPWSILALLASVRALQDLARGRGALVLAAGLVLATASAIHQWTRQWPIACAAGIAGALLLPRIPFERRAPRLRASSGTLALCALLLALLAWPLERFRASQQYDPDYGYRDGPSDRGWGPIVRYVHAHVSHSRVAFHGAGTFFPLYGDDLSNQVFVAPADLAPEALLEWCRENEIDVLVCFVPSQRAEGSTDFVFGTGLGPAIARSSDPPEILCEELGAYVFRL
jgi:hypothetical protein